MPPRHLQAPEGRPLQPVPVKELPMTARMGRMQVIYPQRNPWTNQPGGREEAHGSAPQSGAWERVRAVWSRQHADESPGSRLKVQDTESSQPLLTSSIEGPHWYLSAGNGKYSYH